MEAAALLSQKGISLEVIDLRVLNPFNPEVVINSTIKTGRLLVVDGGWSPCGMAGEVIASVVENINPKFFRTPPARLTLPFSPAPTSQVLENAYYPSTATLVLLVEKMMCDAC